MKNGKKIAIGTIIFVLVAVLVVFIYHSDQGNKINNNQAAGVSVGVSTETVSTSTSSSTPDIFQGTDCETASASSTDGLPTGLMEFSDETWNIVSTKTIEASTTHAHIDIEYPQFAGGDVTTKLNRCVYTLISSILSDDKKRVAEIAKDNPYDYRNSPWDSSVDLKSTYHIAGVNNGIVSIEIVVTDFTGGGNGNHDYSYPINWDLKSNRLLLPSEIFCSKDYVSLLMPLVRKQLTENFNQDTYGFIHPLNDFIIQSINDGTSDDPNNWGSFLIRNDGLVVVFQPYQVASGISGIVRAFIPDFTSPHFLCLP